MIPHRGQELQRPDLRTIRRFLSQVVLAGLEGCWRFGGNHNEEGRPKFNLQVEGRKRKVNAYRVSYAIFHELLEEGYDIHHECRNKWCVNPDHLEAMHREDNTSIENRDNPRARCPLCGKFAQLLKTDYGGAFCEDCDAKLNLEGEDPDVPF